MTQNNENKKPDAIIPIPGGVVNADFQKHNITRRDLFAGLMLQGMLSSKEWAGVNMANVAVEYADSLIKELDNV